MSGNYYNYLQGIANNYIQDIVKLNNWVVYRLERRDNGKDGKIPLNPHTGQNASASNPSTWGSFEDAVKFYQKNGCAGIGFEFGASFIGYVGVDLDDVFREDGTLKPFAQEIVGFLDSYTEYSPSGKGLHIICKSDQPMDSWFNFKISHRNDAIGIEMYDNKRFFTVTGNVYNGSCIQNRTTELRGVYAKYLNKHEEAAPFKQLNNTSDYMSQIPSRYISQIPSRLNVSCRETILPEDEELWQKMFKSDVGSKIYSLFQGETKEYDNDQSRADLALCNYLAYWTNNDVDRMDRMFRQSGLMRDKWDIDTYRDKTIQAALSQHNSHLPASLEQLLNSLFFDDTIPSEQSTSIMTDKQTSDDITELSVADYLDMAFEDDVQKFKHFSGYKTGFSNIDAVTSLYPGLYLLGAIPGLGKTTFVSQLSDNLARAGQHVLLFSLEQKTIELVSKGVSRLTVRENNGSLTGLSSIEVRTFGKSNQLILQAINEYKKISSNEHFISCSFATFDYINKTVKKYISEKQVRPIVIIDYLQIIQHCDSNKNATKDVIDSHVKDLKDLQSSNDLVLIVISSLNRANYMAPIDYESFKETGMIEYSADVVWGLQLMVMNEELQSNKKESVSEKREKIKKAKEAMPRLLELVCIKNRFGNNYSCYFRYYTQYDLFIPVIRQDAKTVLLNSPVTTYQNNSNNSMGHI